jgi:adenylate cyclase
MRSASRSRHFDDFRFDVPTRELFRVEIDGSVTPIALGSRAAEILHLFLGRRGLLVAKKEIMDVAWPDTVVDESNITQQISALRRALDGGRNGTSCIQTVPGRGYRFTSQVFGEDEATLVRPVAVAGLLGPDTAEPSPKTTPLLQRPVTALPSAAGAGRGRAGSWRPYGAGVVALFFAALAAFDWQDLVAHPPIRRAEPPRLSIVVLPFANASGAPKDEELAAALTDDFTTSLAQMRGSFVVARSIAQAMAARKLPLPTVGSELAVRYVLEGNIRRSLEGIELNIQLNDVASGTSIWARQFNEAASEPGDLRRQIAQSLRFPLRTEFMDAEARRISSLPDATLTADDLLLKVSASNNHPPMTPAKNAESTAMLERALALDPKSAEAMISLADQILRPIFEFNDRKDIDERLLRAKTLADQARAFAAGSESMLALQAQILRTEGRFDEALAAYTALMRSSRRFHVPTALCLIALGRSAEAVPLLEEAIRLDRDTPAQFARYNALGFALVRIGRYEEAINWLRAAQQASSGFSPQISMNLTIAYAHAGKIADARHALLELQKRMGGLFDARRMRHTVWTIHTGGATPATVEERARAIEGLVMAGLPDHRSEEDDAGPPITAEMRPTGPFGRTTPIGAPGVSTIKTSELRALIVDGEGSPGGEVPPLLVSTDCSDCLDIAIPGTVFVRDAYRNEVQDDEKRQVLKTFVDSLLHGNQARRVITFSWNAGGWGSRNLAIELVALGYPNVAWYRGGLEAWDVAGLPVTKLK